MSSATVNMETWQRGITNLEGSLSARGGISRGHRPQLPGEELRGVDMNAVVIIHTCAH